jgi:hypothetical protein
MTRHTLETHQSNRAHVLKNILRQTQLHLTSVVGSTRPVR